MRRQGPITLRHVAIAVLVVVVVNAQLTWWIIFVIRQSGTVLELERRLLMDECRFEADRVHAEVKRAEVAAETMLASRDRPLSGLGAATTGPPGELVASLPRPFVRWADAQELEGRPGWHGEPGIRMVYELACPHGVGICGLIADPGWVAGLLKLGEGVELAAAASFAEARPSQPLVAPFDSLVLRPPADAWRELLDEHRRRVVMMVSEGAFFAVLLVVLVGLLWRTVRREVELERQHRNFLSAITHELKSPLAAIRLSLETVASGRADEAAARRFVGNALVDTDRLEGLVSKVLEVTRYGAGTASIHLVRRPLSELVAQALAAFEARFTAAGATVGSAIEPETWAAVDGEAMTIAISNLLENALTYGGRPPVVEITLFSDGDQAVLEVRDNGGGIPEAEIPFIFNRFYRAGDEMTRTTRGTGLGLYLVQRIVKAHHGTVEVAATGDHGTTMRVSVPWLEPGKEPD
jgi:signal transduction histidine kinase